MEAQVTSMFDSFLEFCKAKEVKLTPIQLEVASVIFNSTSGQLLLGGGLGAGKTFLLNLLEDYAHELEGRKGFISNLPRNEHLA